MEPLIETDERGRVVEHVPQYLRVLAHNLVSGVGFRVYGLGFKVEMCCGTEAGSYLRLVDSCITQLKAQGPSRTCNESKEEEEEVTFRAKGTRPAAAMEARNELPSGEGSGVTRRGCAPAWGWVGAI